MKSANSSRASNSEVTLIPLKDPMFISLLKEFKNLLKSNVGPNGNLKLLVSGGGFIQLSSSSSQIIQHYDQFNSPIIQFIAQVMKGQTDFGLYCGLIITSCLEYLLSLQSNEKMTSKESILLIDFIIKRCNQIFDSNVLKIQVNFDSVLNFVPVVTTVIKSKCKKLLMHDSFIREFSLQIIKAFLFSFDIERTLLKNVSIHVFKGEENFKFYPGIIYQLVDSDIWISNLIVQNFHCKTEIKTLLFTTKLSDDDDDNNYLKNECSGDNKLSHIMRILEEAVKCDVSIIACQKVVHPNIVLFLRRKSVIVLERMGSDLAYNFEQLTGSFPISVNKLCLTNLHSMFGTVNKVSSVDIGVKNYILIERNSAAIGTLVLQVPYLSGTQEIKILAEQALITLRSLVKTPFVCPGAGCFEVCLFMNIQALDKENKTNKQFQWLFKVLIEASGNSMPIWVDSVYKHAWSSEEQLKCNCQLISKDEVLRNQGCYQLLSLDDQFCISFNSSGNNYLISELSEHCIVDSLILKQNSVISSLESCVNLLGIGTVACITKK